MTSNVVVPAFTTPTLPATIATSPRAAMPAIHFLSLRFWFSSFSLVEEKMTISFTNGLTFRWNDLDEEIKDLIEIHIQGKFDISAHEIYLNITKKGIQPISTQEETEYLHNDIQLFLRQEKDDEENE